MAKMIINGEVCSGSNSYASAVEYIKEDGSKTTVQDELSELNKKLPFKFGVDDNGNYGYIKDGADTVTPFKNLSDTTAVASHVTSGYVFYDKDGNRCVGTRPAPVTRQSGTSTGFISKGNPNTTYTYDQIVNFSSAFDTVPAVSVSLVSATAGQDGGSVFGDTSVSVVERQRTYFKARVSCIATQYGGTNFKYNWSAQA